MVTNLTTGSEVKLVAGLNNGEVSDGDIGSQITLVTSFLVERYGNPMKKTNITLESDEYTYDFTGDKRPVYRIDYVEIAGSSITEAAGSYTGSLLEGELTLASNLIDEFGNERLEVEWIPKKANLLATYKTALEVLQNLYIVTGDESTSTKVARITKTIEEIEQLFLEESHVIMSSAGAESDPRQGTIVIQDFTNAY